MDQNTPYSGGMAHDFLSSALEHYEAAAGMRPAGNDDALLRWNTCARLMNSHGVAPHQDEPGETLLE